MRKETKTVKAWKLEMQKLQGSSVSAGHRGARTRNAIMKDFYARQEKRDLYDSYAIQAAIRGSADDQEVTVKLARHYEPPNEAQPREYARDQIAQKLGWMDYEHMLRNSDAIEDTLRTAINYVFELRELTPPNWK